MSIGQENQALYRFRLANSELFEYQLLNQRSVSILPLSGQRNGDRVS